MYNFRTVTVSNCIVCHALVPNSDNVLLATIDGSIFTFDQVSFLFVKKYFSQPVKYFFRLRTELITRCGRGS